MDDEKNNQAPETMYDKIGLRGCFDIALTNAFAGEIIKRGHGENAVLYVGRSWGLEKLCNSAGAFASTNVLSVIRIGTGTTAAASSQTNLLAYLTYKTAASAITTYSSTNPYVQFTCSWESTELDSTFAPVIEFAVANGSNSTVPAFCRYVSAATLGATTSNQLLVTYSISN